MNELFTRTIDPTPNPPGDEELNTSWAILILLSLLYIILLTGYFFRRKKITIIHETVVSIILGMGVGLILNLVNSTSINHLVSFDHTYFFNLLLPPIILNSGYDMHRQNFFKNFGTILVFALVGTLISTVIIGSSLFGLVQLGLNGLKLNFLDCITIGAILSSTDPVTILAIFQQLQVDEKLYAIVFGESLLNDSVAIVLFGTLGQLKGHDFTLATFIKGSLSFFGVFSGSLIIGVLTGLSCALLLKHTQLHKYPTIESSLVLIQAYSSYILSNAVQYSGIVSLLFCGVVMKHYAYDNMSQVGQQTTKYMFRVLSDISENFIFIYLGLTLFTKTNQTFYPTLICLTLLIILIARYFSVVPIAWIINTSSRFRSGDVEDKIPRNHQLMIWWAGLRGAIAFALSYEVEGPEKQAIQTTILVVCVISIIILGGTTPLALNYLQIKTGGHNLPTDFAEIDLDSDQGTRSSFDSDILPTSTPHHWFLSFDSKYLKPLFGKTFYGRTTTIGDLDSPSRTSLLISENTMPQAVTH